MELIELFSSLDIWLEEFLMNAGVLAPLLCCILIFLESILAFLPLVVFVTVNVLSLTTLLGEFWGSVVGIILSWIFSTLGGFTTFTLVRKVFNKPFRKRMANHPKVNKFMNMIDKLKYSNLVLITSIPFSPSFFINLGAGLSNVNSKKYFCALMIGKFVEMIFLGYVGVSVVECLTNPMALIKVVVIIVIGYVISVIVNKKFDLDERFE
ncbi:MAG: TVP38/TMEM64 family protein [Candidatus Coprovivens sp.]